MKRDAPDWLSELQAQFGSVIRTPLDRSSGTLTATPSSYDPRVVAETRAERLAVYNRQYWFRLFDVFQTAFPLTTRLLGHWTFNDYAARFLIANPPRGWDIDRVLDRFEASFDGAHESVIEGARIDAAWRNVFSARDVIPFRPSAQDAARLLDSRLVPSLAVAIFEEHWPLLELRRKIRDDGSEKPVELPPSLAQPRWWALVRRPEGIAQLPLDPREARLLALLQRHAVRDALAELEAACTEDERTDLPNKTRTWLARSVELDFWIGIDSK